MKAKIYITFFASIMSLNILAAQQVIYGDQNKTTDLLANSSDHNKITPANTSAYYVVDKIVPNTFTTMNNTLIICRIVPGSKDDIICSTNRPENGWGTMIDQENGQYSYEEKHYKDESHIYSIAYTDQHNGWAVGVMETYSRLNGVVFNTKDGGETWNLQFLGGSGMELFSVGFTDSKNGWANGKRTIGKSTFDIMLVTANGGETWNEENPATTDGQLGSSDPY